jgi:hypothetical protein
MNGPINAELPASGSASIGRTSEIAWSLRPSEARVTLASLISHIPVRSAAMVARTSRMKGVSRAKASASRPRPRRKRTRS